MNTSPLARLARLCYRRRRIVLVTWLVATVAILFVGFSYAAAANNTFTGGNSQSQLAQNILNKHFPEAKGDTVTLVVHADAGVRNPDVQRRFQAVIADFERQPDIVAVTGGPSQISPDGKTAFAVAHSSQTAISNGDATNMIDTVKKASGDGVTFAVGGTSIYTVETPYGGSTEGIGGIATMIVLLIAFGSLLAMGLPLLTALFGIGTGLALIELLGHLLPAPSFSPILASLLGLGVGVDYALFIVTRYREALHNGADPEEATVTSLATSGRSVAFAGITVVIAMLGLFVMNQALLNATAVAASVTVLATMAAALTLLPAMLGFTGHNIDRLKLPYLGRTRTGSPMAERWARTVQKRPVTAAIAAVAVLVVLALPMFSMRLGFEDSSDEPHSTSGYMSHHLLAEGFGAGYDAPLIVVADPPGSLAAVAAKVRATPGIAQVTPVRASNDGKAAMFIAYPTTSAQNPATPKLVDDLRSLTKDDPAVHVGGPNAGTVDFANAVSTRLPWLIAVVIGLALLLLMTMVRSVVIALKAAVVTLLSVGATYGVLTAIVQWGWLGHLLGFPTPMPITTWVPLFIFPILFGLSTDYEVFLVSRIREEYDGGLETREAVARGLSHTARVITAAAAIMVVVFLTVLIGKEVGVKQFGLGLAVAVFIDATLVRMVLVPAVMELLGRANWWMPGWLNRVLPAPERTVPKTQWTTRPSKSTLT